MEEKKQKGSGFAWPSAAVVAALAATLAHNVHLRSSRPEEKGGHEHTAKGDQTIQARLWQDPFAAVDAYKKQNSEKEQKGNSSNGNKEGSSSLRLHSVEEVTDQIYRRLSGKIPDVTNVALYYVMVSNGPYVEDAERRMRTRYAVISALVTAGYVPWDEEHIGYFNLFWPRGSNYESIALADTPPLSYMPGGQDDELSVPFEWFQPSSLRPAQGIGRSPPPGAILVLWLDRDAFADYPTRRLSQLIEAMQRGPGGPLDQERLRLKLLDPSLGAILSERSSAAANNTVWVRPPSVCVSNQMELYSTWSTTADALLGGVKKPTSIRRQAIAEELAPKGFQLINVTATDDELTMRLIEELKNRGIDLSNPRHNIALVSESDTFYGRALPLTFAANAILRAQKHGHRPPEEFSAIIQRIQTNLAVWPINIHLSSYLRGVDGRMPGEVVAKPEPGQEKDKGTELQQLERPEGPSQLDYMPRLALELRDHEKENEKEGRSGFKAIGILGSDVYDKLLLLQALHKLFPAAIFFTTDLDARLLHPTELKWSRNLLVASSFGFSLNDEEPNLTGPGPPPFRDTYQTGQYLATLMAFGRLPTEYTKTIEARLFEIGRNGPYILDSPRTRADLAANSASIYPERPRFDPRWSDIISVAGGLSLACLLLSYYCGPLQRFGIIPLLRSFMRISSKSGQAPPGPELAYFRMFAACIIVGIGLYYIIKFDHNREGGEPFSLVAGISLWPSVLLNFLAACLSCFFLLKALRDLKSNETDLETEFGIKPEGASPKKTRWCEKLKEGNFFRWQGDANAIDVKELWRQNKQFGESFRRFLRCTGAVLYCIVLGICLLFIFGVPFRPYRGGWNNISDFVFSILSSLAIVVLLFFVVDATLLCNRFIEHLSKTPSTWPERALDAAHKRTMDKEDLSEWLVIQFIAKRTKVVSRLIFYPFIVLSLMILARTELFDHFEWPLSLVLLFGVLAAYAIYCAWDLRRTAESARETQLRRLNERLLRVRAGGTDLPRVGQIELTIDEVKANEEGAFAPFSQHPLPRSLLLPFTSAGFLTLLDYFPLH